MKPLYNLDLPVFSPSSRYILLLGNFWHNYKFLSTTEKFYITQEVPIFIHKEKVLCGIVSRLYIHFEGLGRDCRRDLCYAHTPISPATLQSRSE